MSKPVLDVSLESLDGMTGRALAVIDTGSHRTLIREDCVPKGASVVRSPRPSEMKTAAKGGKLHIVGGLILTIMIRDRMIQDDAFVSPDLSQEMIIGAGTMQKWDITIRNENGHTEVVVGKDLRDPDIQEVD